MTDFDAGAKDWDSDLVRVERAKAVADAIRAQVPLSKEMTAFEYGCGTGLVSFFLQPYLGLITLADNSSGMLAALAGKIAAAGVHNMQPLKLDLVTDVLPADRYNLIYNLMTLHHIQDTDGTLQAFHTLLNRPGFLCIIDLDKEDGSFHTDPEFNGHAGFDRAELSGKLVGAGFANIHFLTCYETPKNGRNYTLFLAIAEKK